MNNNGSTTATICGTPTAGDTVTLTTNSAGLSGGSKSKTYTVTSSDTIVSIAAGLSTLVNADTALQQLELTASSSTPATLNWSQSFSANPPIGPQANSLAISAIDGGGNQTTNSLQVLNGNNATQSLTYDLNGNMTSDGTNTYTWDAENRLLQINYPGTGNNSQFIYDAFAQIVAIVENSGGTIVSTKQFVWAGVVLAPVGL